MKVVGITGNMGSGKTTVLNMFQKLGVSTYIADVEAKRLMNDSPDIQSKIIKNFGSTSYKEGRLNRSYLAEIVFKDPKKLKILNSIVHPAVQFDFKNFIKKAEGEYVLYESALLFQSNVVDMFTYIILVTAPYNIRVSRVLERDHTNEDDIKRRLNHQNIPKESLVKVDFIIENLDLENTKSQVLDIHRQILNS